MVVAVMATLASMAVPSYRQLIAQKDVERASLQLRDHMELARTYAQTHQTEVIICPVAPSQLDQNQYEPLCTGIASDWPAWVVKTRSGQVLVSSLHLPEGVTIDSGSRSQFVFNPRGGANGYNGSVDIVGFNNVAKSITIAADGRIQMANQKIVQDAVSSNISSSASQGSRQ